MALGGFVVVLSTLTGTVFYLIFFAIVPLLEALSVMIQVFSFKVFHRRIFKVSPLHHHFERAEGIDYPYLLPNIELPEWVITLMFWGLTALGAAVGVWAYF
jgi:phospho-N-acetylmuramoyl-pentapeptide-transferase